MIKYFTIYGERNSGTKLLETIIRECFDLELTWRFGYKHFFGHQKHKIKQENRTLFLGIVRNPYNWINSMIKRPYHVPETNRKNIKNFLFNEWYSVYDEQKHGNNLGKEIYEDRYWINNTRHCNIFQMRQRKLLFLKKDMPNIAKNYYLVRYEDLCKNPNSTLSNINNIFRIQKSGHLCTQIEKKSVNIEKRLKQIITKYISWTEEYMFNYREE